MSYKVTVIIPSYNSVEFLDETIGSIREQTFGFENIEIIIVDDYSTDATPEIINDYCNRYENIRTYESGKKTGTPGRARNIAIKKAEADYVMFIDHDDKYLPDTVEKLYNAIVENSADVAIGKFQTFGDRYIVSEDWVNNDIILNSIDENPLFFSINNIWRMIFPKSLLLKQEIEFPEGVFAEDLTFMIDVFVNSYKIVFINDVVYNFRLRTGDTTSTSLSKGMHYLNGLIEGYEYTAEVLEKNNALKYYDRVFNQHISCWLSDVALSEKLSEEDKKELIEKSVPFIWKMENIEPYPLNNALKNIMLSIKEERLSDAYNQMKEYKFFTYKVVELENELDYKKNQIATLQTTKGWFKYKYRNILERLRKKV